uniref:Uncharacterized protein n=1 Tax=Arundo donax TaxID=35708 RepID=A0A0A9E3G3_ARUDO
MAPCGAPRAALPQPRCRRLHYAGRRDGGLLDPATLARRALPWCYCGGVSWCSPTATTSLYTSRETVVATTTTPASCYSASPPLVHLLSQPSPLTLSALHVMAGL